MAASTPSIRPGKRGNPDYRATATSEKISLAGIGAVFFRRSRSDPTRRRPFVSRRLARILRVSGFALQFAAFSAASLCLYFAILGLLNRSMQTIGGVMHGEKAVLQQAAFFVASLFAALICMAIASQFKTRVV